MNLADKDEQIRQLIDTLTSSYKTVVKGYLLGLIMERINIFIRQTNMEQLINDIIRERNKQVPQIDAQISNLQSLLANLESYNELRKSIVDDDGHLKEDGKYGYLVKHPNVVASIYDARPDELYPAIREHITRLERLKLRFSRKSLTIQIFGDAGSGKSTFIQSITNLDNNVVMAAEGDHCTGTTSYIRNIDKDRFEARIYPYTKFEILNIFNDGLKESLKAKNLKEVSISSFDEIENFDLQQIGLSTEDYIVSHYITYFSVIKSVLNKLEDCGLMDDENNRRYIRIENPAEVQQYVAHHNDYETKDPRYKTYQKYLAVKFVRIFTRFAHKKAGQIELLDSVGFGDIATKSIVEKGMYQSIADNCDIVAIICYPFKRSDIEAAANTMDKAHYKGQLPNRTERISGSCLFLVLNNDRRPSKNNTDSCNYAQSAWTNGIDPKVDSPYHRTETVLCADLHDPKETECRILVPILQQVTQNLPDIDHNLKKEVNDKTLELQQQYNTFIQNISNVLIVSPTSGSHTEFDNRFSDIYEKMLRKELGEIVETAKSSINQPAASLGRALDEKCNDDSISRYIEELNPDIDAINPASTPAEWLRAYEKLASKLAHLIPTRFKDIDSNLSRNMAERKAAVFNCLYHTGRLNVILKIKENPSSPEYENTLDWAERLNELIVTETEYPTLHNIIHELLAFNITTDGMLLFRIVKHFDELTRADKAPDQNIILKKRGKAAMLFYLRQNLKDAFGKIKPELENFTIAPNEAIYYTLDSFVYNLLYHPGVERELRNLYEQFEKQIWRDELESIQAQTIALEEWKQMRDQLLQTSINTL